VSASEKLKALDKPLPPSVEPPGHKGYVLANALPQIVAVVEAAKLGRHYTKAMHEWYFNDVGDIATADTIYAHVEKIDAALAALEEALS